jgi:hypothetical protein
MISQTSGVSVIVSSGGQGRLHLLDPTLRAMRRCHGVGQLILSEIGAEPHAIDIARRWDADYLFTHAPGQFDRARALNMGSRLARHEEILWCDGDLIFGEDFLPLAQEELKIHGLDYLWPFTSIAYLGEGQSGEVIAGRRRPADCQPIYARRPLRDNAGAMGLVTRNFLRRHGGMIEGFRGWGAEDNAWAHKAALMGKAGITQRLDQQVWHLYHADSGSHSATANRLAHRRNPSFAHNMALLDRVCRISMAEEMTREFPPASTLEPPWRASSRILFVVPAASSRTKAAARAKNWAARLEAAYGCAIPVVRADMPAVADAVCRQSPDIVVGFADAKTGCAALSEALGDYRAILVADDPDGQDLPPLAGLARHALLARTHAQAARWRLTEPRVWHRAWEDGDAVADDFPGEALPVLVQTLSYVLGLPQSWTLRITLDRGALPMGAVDRPAFWYLAFHDAEGAEIARVDANPSELSRLFAGSTSEIVLERTVRTVRLPAYWTIWPVDRRRYWLEKIDGAVTAEMATPAGYEHPSRQQADVTPSLAPAA